MAETTQYVPGLRHPDAAATYTSSSSGSAQIVYYTSDPNSESLTPDDVNAEAIATKEDGTGPIYTWNITLQTWN